MNFKCLRWPSGVHSVNSIWATSSGFNHTQFFISSLVKAHWVRFRSGGTMSAHEDQLARRVAACACGALRVTTIGTPAIVNACACLDCQRRCGSAFTYTAFFPDAQVQIEGEFRSFRELRRSNFSLRIPWLHAVGEREGNEPVSFGSKASV